MYAHVHVYIFLHAVEVKKISVALIIRLCAPHLKNLSIIRHGTREAVLGFTFVPSLCPLEGK